MRRWLEMPQQQMGRPEGSAGTGGGARWGAIIRPRLPCRSGACARMSCSLSASSARSRSRAARRWWCRQAHKRSMGRGSGYSCAVILSCSQEGARMREWVGVSGRVLALSFYNPKPQVARSLTRLLFSFLCAVTLSSSRGSFLFISCAWSHSSSSSPVRYTGHGAAARQCVLR